MHLVCYIKLYSSEIVKVNYVGTNKLINAIHHFKLATAGAENRLSTSVDSKSSSWHAPEHGLDR